MTTATPMSVVKALIRTASLAAALVTVNSNRSGIPILPYVTSPTCKPIPKSMSQRRAVQNFDPFRGLPRGVDGGGGSLAFALFNREDGQHGIADESQHFTAMIADGARHTIEELVQIAQEVFPRHTVGDGPGIAEITKPDHRMNILSVAPLHLPIEDALACSAAEKGAH